MATAGGNGSDRRERGFTLVELLVVLGILALVLALVPPLLSSGRTAAELSATARAIAAALRETRGLAIGRGRTEAFLVDTGTGTFGGATLHRAPAGIGLSLFTTSDDAVDATRGFIRFFPDGSSTGGGVRLVQGDRRSDVLVDWLSGRVSFATLPAPR